MIENIRPNELRCKRTIQLRALIYMRCSHHQQSITKRHQLRPDIYYEYNISCVIELKPFLQLKKG